MSVKFSQLKRHSLATISDFLGRGSGDRGYTLPSFRGFSNLGTDSSVKNELLESVQTAIVQLFQKKRLATELHILQENVRRLTKTDSSPPIYDYFKEKLLRKGMVILRESMKNQTGASLLEKLGQQWSHFYTVILPLLQAILYPLPEMDLPIRETCLVEFRDTVVLKINLMESLEFPDVEVSPLIEQMLLVLQSVRDTDPPNKNYLRLEKLVARVVVPYLGHRGLYEGQSEPEIASLFASSGKDTDSAPEQSKPDETTSSKTSSLSLPRHVLFSRPAHHRQNSAISINMTLAPVAENDFMRRHSIALEQVS
ncbi:proline-rich protein 5-like isoform X2 [Liolophura sinensis]|uniref:proline-rich protein 5-like isoform X2 n=1 Tax=Liolophura sinensis TaxID=3198878 RepID=UPI0031595FD8